MTGYAKNCWEDIRSFCKTKDLPKEDSVIGIPNFNASRSTGSHEKPSLANANS
jgi:hypothetical protein